MERSTYAEVDLSAIRDNIGAIRAKVGAGVRVMPAVKADAYGHGAVEVSRACIEAGADALCVACVDEGIELREAGVNVPLLILGCSDRSAAQEIVRHDIISTVCDVGFADELSRQAVKLGKAAKVHIKVDTGMGRIGVSPEHAAEFAGNLKVLPGVEIDGVFTHFATSDEADRSFALHQISVFEGVVSGLKSRGITGFAAHASNSGGILAFPEAYYDAVRPGIILYGCYPSKDVPKSVQVREVMTLKTRIVFIKDVDSDTPVSYGRTYKAARRSKVATLPIGYADGYSRKLSNCGEACVRGRRVPIIGRVCMDQCLADVTDVPGVQLGDEVVLYGGGCGYLSVTNIADKIGTISYEVFCNLGKRVPRVYLNA